MGLVLRRGLELVAGWLSHMLDRALRVGLEQTALGARRVLLIRLDAIGDFVLWLEAGRVLAADLRLQGYEVVLLANSTWADWASSLGIADEVWALDVRRFRNGFVYRARWLRKMARAGFVRAIQPAVTRVFRLGDALIEASAAHERIAFGAAPNDHPALRLLSDRWYSRLISAPAATDSELETNARFMCELGYSNFEPALADLRQSEVSRAASVLLCPSASWAGKRWPEAHYVALGRRIADTGSPVVVAGGPQDTALVQRIAAAIGSSAAAAVCTDIRMLLERCLQARLVVANDSAALHIAAASGAASVCISGGGHPGRFLPYPERARLPGPAPVVVERIMACYGCGWHCIHSRRPDESALCLSKIDVEDVWAVMQPIMWAGRVVRSHS